MIASSWIFREMRVYISSFLELPVPWESIKNDFGRGYKVLQLRYIAVFVIYKTQTHIERRSMTDVFYYSTY